MKWTKLYGNALTDERLLALLERLSLEGLGIYYAVLMQVECIGEGAMPLEQIVASFKRRVARKKILSVICDYSLFEVSDFDIIRPRYPLPGYPALADTCADACAERGTDAGETPAGTGVREEKISSVFDDDHPILKPVLRFVKPTREEVRDYCREKGYNIDPDRFYDFNETRAWMIGKTLMKSWKGALSTWVKKEKQFQAKDAQPDDDLPKPRRAESPDALIPPNAPPRPSPTAQWDFATDSWNDFY